MSVLIDTYTLSNGNQIPKIGFGTWLLNAELDFEISAADMSVLDAMRDTEKHEDAREFRWK